MAHKGTLRSITRNLVCQRVPLKEVPHYMENNDNIPYFEILFYFSTIVFVLDNMLDCHTFVFRACDTSLQTSNIIREAKTSLLFVRIYPTCNMKLM